MPPDVDNSREFAYTRDDFDGFRQRAMDYSGIQVTDDKFEMYYARLSGRVRKLGLQTFAQYLQLLDQDKAEFKNFINAITTNVTSFEREPHHFAFLKQELNKHKGNSYRIWSAGCSSGEEPYSVIVNTFDTCQQNNIKLDILATDLDTDVLEKAAAGVYPLDAIKAYPMATKRQFFVKGIEQNSGRCRVKPEFRKLIRYDQINLHNAWGERGTFHGIFCRNVMIYFDLERKRRIVDRFAEALEPGGLLFIGHSESLHQMSDRFEHAGQTIFRKVK